MRSSVRPPRDAIDAPYDQLAALPRALWLPTLVASVGEAEARLVDMQRWHEALDAGELPGQDADCGAADAVEPFRRVIGELGLARLACGAPAFAEQILRTLLWHLDHIIDLQPRLTRTQAIEHCVAEFRAAWVTEKGDWDQLLALLQGLGALASLRWDELRGHLQSRAWQEAQALAALLGRMPALVELVRRLGRSERSVAPRVPPLAQPLEAPSPQRQGLRVVETRLPDMPGELRGIRFSDRLETMLASEAAMIRHPVLHKLWRAKRAEARLLSWDSEAVLLDLRPDPHAPPRAAQTPRPPEPLERGPMILCVDTSGSMRGAPERIAKAVVIEAVRTAHREKRGCRVIAFGGPDEVVEHELALTPEGFTALLEFIGQGFDGGTDVQSPIERAVARVHEAQWASADLLIVSDGEFGCAPATLEALDAARAELGLRVQGVLVGDRETMGLMEVCDHIFWVRDWRGHSEGARPADAAFSPVHSKSLTALFFPNALSERAARLKDKGKA